MRGIRAHSLLILTSVILCLLLGSCNKLREPVLLDARITSGEMKGLKSAEVCVSLTLENPNKKSLSAESFSGSISKGGEMLATFEMTGGPIVAPPSSTTTLPACIIIDIPDPLALIAAGISLRDPDLNALTADADIHIMIGETARRIRLNDMPLKNLVQRFKL